MIKPILSTVFAAGCLGIWLFLGPVQAQDTELVVVKPYAKDFILVAGSNHSIYVPLHPPEDAAKGKTTVTVDNFSIGLKSLPPDLRELPEIKLECGGIRYVVPARKVVVVPTAPTKQGVFVQTALDPSGTGNFEVLLTINWPDWPDTDKRIELLRRIIPETMEVVENSSSWYHPNGGLCLTKTLVFHNRTGKPFVLDTGYFENLPTNEGWPTIEIPPAAD